MSDADYREIWIMVYTPAEPVKYGPVKKVLMAKEGFIKFVLEDGSIISSSCLWMMRESTNLPKQLTEESRVVLSN